MNLSYSRALGSLIGTLALTVATSASAQDNGPCGNFDFTTNFDCAIKVEGSCTADCSSLKFEVGCTGVCTEVAAPPCVDSCGTACLAECDPALLDCFVGCHDECDQPTIDICLAENNPDDDCVEIATAACDIHCKDSCAVPPSDCLDHCETCCTGGCATQANYSCNYDCFAELSGSCEAHCNADGAIFCNGQFVNASDIEACITYLLEQGIEVDVSARGSVSCDGSGCDAESVVDGVGCSASPGLNAAPGAGWGVLGLCAMGLVIGVANERRRRRM